MQTLISELAYRPHNLFVLGSVGSGKTALSFKIMELIHNLNPARPVYIHNYPDESIPLLPDWVHLETDINKIPYGAIVVKDDTSLDDSTHAKGKRDQQKEFAQEMAVCRQKMHTILFTVQNTYWMSLDLERAGNNHFIYKWYDYRSIVREREEIQGNLYAVMELMKQYISDGYQRQQLAYVSSPFYEGFLSSNLPTFWSQDLSEILGRVRCQ